MRNTRRDRMYPPSKLLPAKPAAIYLGVPYTSLRDLANKGAIEVVKLRSRWYFRRDDLDNLIERNVQRLG